MRLSFIVHVKGQRLREKGKMPELPEIEILKNEINAQMVGKEIVEARFSSLSLIVVSA